MENFKNHTIVNQKLLSYKSVSESGKFLISGQNKIAVCYHYYSSNSGVDEKNLAFFIKNGISKDFDLYITYSSPIKLNQNILPNAVYIEVKNSENRDWNGYRIAAQIFNKNLNYEYCFFMNSGVEGPHVKHGEHWWLKFIELFSSKVKLVGTSICMPYMDGTLFPHVQSMFFCLHRDALKFLSDFNFFDLEVEYKRKDMIKNFEIRMSSLILQNNWNINAILPEFRDINYAKVTKCFNPTAVNGDPYFPGAYFGRTIIPNDVIFFKNSRFKSELKKVIYRFKFFLTSLVDRN